MMLAEMESTLESVFGARARRHTAHTASTFSTCDVILFTGHPREE